MGKLVGNVVVTILVCSSLVACSLGSGKQGGTSPERRDSAAELLVGIDGARSRSAYSNRLDSLESKCESDGRDRIADNVAGAVKFLETKGQPAKALEVMDGMLAAIPDEASGQVRCADVAVGLVTTMTGGSVEVTPRP